jgi:hypothetical protein
MEDRPRLGLAVVAAGYCEPWGDKAQAGSDLVLVVVKNCASGIGVTSYVARSNSSKDGHEGGEAAIFSSERKVATLLRQRSL